jgi:prepilin peptidase dependent protein B
MQALNKSRGFTLIEVMVSMTIGLIVVGAVIALMVNTLNVSSRNIQGSQVAQELRATMEILSRDLRRAGAIPNVIDCYARNSCTNIYAKVTYFPAAEPDDAKTCVIFSLDRDSDGADDPNEWAGFRYNAAEGAIEMKILGKATDIDCNDGDGVTWVKLTDTDIVNVTAFKLDIEPSYTSLVRQNSTTSSYLDVRKVEISITGELASGGSEKTIYETIRLRNDRFYTN